MQVADIDGGNNFTKEWFDRVSEDLSNSDKAFLKKAVDWAQQHLRSRVIFTHEPCIHHVKGVVRLLSLLQLDVATMVAGIIMTVPIPSTAEENKDFKDTVIELFGQEVFDLVEGAWVLVRIGAATSNADLQTAELEEYQQEMQRKMLLAMATDLRIVLIRLASRLQSLRWYNESKLACPKIIALQTRNIYAPLANRLGIWQIKWEMEDLAFRFLEPDIYHDIAKRLESTRVEREAFVNNFVSVLKKRLDEIGIKGDVAGRVKHIYSIYNKMKNKHLDFDQLFDLHAIRIIVPNERDCYAALAMVHSCWDPVMDEFDDYIARPKPNGYRSLHTVVRDHQGRLFEVQIRTRKMHEFAEYGLAAHWRYKESGAKGGQTTASSLYDRQISWMRQLLSWRKEVGIQEQDDKVPIKPQPKTTNKSQDKDVIGRTQPSLSKAEVTAASANAELPVAGLTVAAASKTVASSVSESADSVGSSSNNNKSVRQPKPDKIYVLTPQARVIELPEGSTPIDFAYYLHTDLGHRCRGSRVDGQLVALNTKLKNGQTVEIITAKSGGPSRDWLNPQLGYLASPRTKAKVRLWFNAIELEKRITTGQEQVEKELQRLGKTAVNMDNLASHLGFARTDDLYVAVAKDEFSLRSLAQFFSEPEPQESEHPDEVVNRMSISNAQSTGKSGVLVVGVDSLLTQLAGCCHPAPPDKIGGFVTRGRGVSIHRSDCSSFRALSQKHPERVIEVDWGNTEDTVYPANIMVAALDRKGLLRDIIETLAKLKINVMSANTKTKEGMARMNFTIEIKNGEQLNKAIAAISQIHDVSIVKRT